MSTHRKQSRRFTSYSGTALAHLRAIRNSGETSEVKFGGFAIDMQSGLSTRMRMFCPDLASPPRVEYEMAPADVSHSAVPAYTNSDLDYVLFTEIVVSIGKTTYHFFPTPSGHDEPQAAVPVDLSRGLNTMIAVRPGDHPDSLPMGPGFMLTLTQADPSVQQTGS